MLYFAPNLVANARIGELNGKLVVLELLRFFEPVDDPEIKRKVWKAKVIG